MEHVEEKIKTEKKRDTIEWININKDLYNYKSNQKKDFLHK